MTLKSQIIIGAVFSVIIIGGQYGFISSLESSIERGQRKLTQKVTEIYLEKERRSDALIEPIALDKRVANVLSYQLDQNPALSNNQEFISKLSSAVLEDTIRELAFNNLREFGSTRTELIALGDSEYLFRDKWTITIKPGSHFYAKPITTSLFINEGFPAPACDASKGFEPYIAYISTNPELTIRIAQDHNIPTLLRVTALDKTNRQVFNNVEDRVLIDAGCIVSNPSTANELGLDVLDDDGLADILN
ncbi:TPA: hypothetical protein I7682_17885 [Vibrio vulnificus]|nr:hypothetical protein [Vibrio vulnificus]